MSAILASLFDALASVGGKAQNAIDGIFPPEKRAETLTSLRTFAINNPKLAAFLASQIAFTGLPLLLFLTFSVTIFIFSFITIFFISVLAALLFTVFMAGLALLVFLPTAFFTTFAATFLFLWGIGAYYMFQRFTGGDAPAARHSTIGDRISNLTNGGKSWLLEWENKEQEHAKNGLDRAPPTPERGGKQQNGDMNGKTGVDGEEYGNSTKPGAELSTATSPTPEKQANGAQKQTQDLSNSEKSMDYPHS